MATATKPTSMRERITSEIETVEIQELIVATLKTQAHKPVTVRLAARVEMMLQSLGARDYGVRLSRQYGMTNLEWGGYCRTGGREGGSILLSHNERSEPIGQKYLDDMDSYLAAKHERNAQRRRLLDSAVPEQIDALAKTLAETAAAYDAIHDSAEGNWSVLPSRTTLFNEILDR